MDILQREAFAPRAHETFELTLGESRMTLTELKALPSPPAPGLTRQPFALTFRSASSIVLPQRLYRLVNATLGLLDLFLVPVGRDPQGVDFQVTGGLTLGFDLDNSVSDNSKSHGLRVSVQSPF